MDLPRGTESVAFACPDATRVERTGQAEAIYAPGKTPAEVALLVARRPCEPTFVTRADEEIARHVLRWCPGGLYYPRARLLVWGRAPRRPGRVAVVTAGTADLPVALEARFVLEHMGVLVDWLPDRGVASPQRSLQAAEAARAADVVVVVAGMDGALPSVLAGSLARPVVAVPTASGYGVAADGRSALGAMLASCADAVTVVNVGNGYGAAAAALRMIRPEGAA
jgi:NCAIR mutase (PurE)-related protein